MSDEYSVRSYVRGSRTNEGSTRTEALFSFQVQYGTTS